MKDFNTLIYDCALHRGKKPFLFLFLQAFSIEKILKCHVKDCFKINDKLMIKMMKKVNTLDYERKIKSTIWFMQFWNYFSTRR